MYYSPSKTVQAKKILDQLSSGHIKPDNHELERLLRLFPDNQGKTMKKSILLAVYRKLYSDHNANILKLLKKKPVRTLSGVTPVTVLTKPYPCPGSCIFCPVDVRMPKSYIASEPGAQRAAQNGFDPYLQVYNRLQAYREIGHPYSKIELIVLGGTWSVYPETYQVWFIKRLFDALNDFGADQDNRPALNPVDLSITLPEGISYNQYIAGHTSYLGNSDETSTWTELEKAHLENERSQCRCVGLVLETRPDYTTEKEVTKLRRLGATKIQVGIQSLSDKVLSLNRRGHSVKEIKLAIKKLRLAGFKIHAHWMPNLYGSDPKKDIRDYQKLFSDPDICPDELKVYPCSLIPQTELVDIYNRGLWKPYTESELSTVIKFVLENTPEYCRLTRIIRDIPGNEIMAGNKTTNFRQIIEKNLSPSKMKDIRAREIKGIDIEHNSLYLDVLTYTTTVSKEYFLQYITKERRIASFLRLSVPKVSNFLEELKGSAIIREIHVYGQSVTVGETKEEHAQHQGMGKSLITEAVKICKGFSINRLAVISAVGTREYYRKLGFKDGNLYQHLSFG